MLFAAVMAPTGSAVGAAGYDFSNPSSTGCNTVWAHITRTDTKRCLTSGQYCAKIRVTRVLSNGTNRSVFTANAVTVGGRAIGVSGHLSVDANGNWTSS